MQTSVERIAKKASEDKKHRFGNLFREINEEFLHDCWGKLNKQAAAGVDGVNYQTYQKHLGENIATLVDKLKSKRYRAMLVRRKYIPKGNGKMRPLGIPAIDDKLLQCAVARILNAIYEQDFLDCSYGYRPNRGAIDAVKAVKRTLQQEGSNYVVEADIKGFFDNIDHDWLIRMLEQRINDKSIMWLIKKWLKAGILDEDGSVSHPVAGTPQGGVISPILANIYMHYVLNNWFEKVVRKHCRGRVSLCVYADDFICVFEYKKDAEKFYAILGKRFGKFKLELASEKTNIIDFRKWCNTKVEFLGFEFRLAMMSKRFVKIRTSRKKLINSMQNVKEWCKKFRSLKLKVFMKKLNEKMTGYYNYFAVRGNHKSITDFYYSVIRIVFKWLNRRSQKRSYNWDTFKEMLKAYPLPKPRIVHL